jgi:hypothetical protein
MIRQVVIIIDQLDRKTTNDIENILSKIPIDERADIIINDSIDSVVNILRTLNVKGAMN